MEAALDYADGIRHAASCHRAQYSCVLTSPDLKVLAYGYNGVARGLPNGCLRPNEPGHCGCLHAEVNAVAALRRIGYTGSIVAFITGEPCEACAMLLLNVDTKMVVYRRPSHRPYAGVELLQHAGIPHGCPEEMAQIVKTIT